MDSSGGATLALARAKIPKIIAMRVAGDAIISGSKV